MRQAKPAGHKQFFASSAEEPVICLRDAASMERRPMDYSRRPPAFLNPTATLPGQMRV